MSCFLWTYRDKSKCGSTFFPKTSVCQGLHVLLTHVKPRSERHLRKKIYTGFIFLHAKIKFCYVSKTDTSWEPSFGTQQMSFWMKKASLEKTWVTSMWKGGCLIYSTPFLPTALLHRLTNVNSMFWCVPDGCQEWRSRNKRPMSITDPWMVMEISTGGLFSTSITFPQNSCALSQGKWVKSYHILNMNVVCVKIRLQG